MRVVETERLVSWHDAARSRRLVEHLLEPRQAVGQHRVEPFLLGRISCAIEARPAGSSG